MKKDFLFVGIQAILFLGYLFDPVLIDNLTIGEFRWLGLTFAILGGLILLIALLQLNKNLSPFPTPLSDSQLITNGLFAYVRHPIYSGIILGSAGYGLFNESLWKMLIALSLWFLFHFKAKYEEQLLINKFLEYEAYIDKTGRFFPKLSQ